MLPVIELTTPINLPDEDGAVKLRFKRRMNGGDLAHAGISLSLSGEGDFELSAAQVNTIAARCCEVPDKTIEALDGADWLKVLGIVTGFFVPAAPENGAHG